MTKQTKDHDTFVHARHTAYQEVRLHSPQGIPENEQRLRSKLERHGITLTSDILLALAFAAAEGTGPQRGTCAPDYQ